MKRTFKTVIVGVVATLAPGCGPPAGSVLQDLFKTSIPAKVKVVHYRAETIGMDPSFAWELAPIDEAFLKKLIVGGGLKSATVGNRPAPSRERWPKWWNARHLEALPECYFDDSGGLRRIWVDRKGNRMFVEFLGT